MLGRDVLIREYAPLHHLLNAIPQKAQRGLRTSSVDLTCIDITREYVAVGSNIGIIFLYDRDKQTVQRLKCQVCTINSFKCKIFASHVIYFDITVVSPYPATDKQGYKMAGKCWKLVFVSAF